MATGAVQAVLRVPVPLLRACPRSSDNHITYIIIFFECALLLQVLWTIDNYIPYGYGLMTLLLFGASQAASESPSPFSPTRMHVLLLCCITHHPMF